MKKSLAGIPLAFRFTVQTDFVSLVLLGQAPHESALGTNHRMNSSTAFTATAVEGGSRCYHQVARTLMTSHQQQFPQEMNPTLPFGILRYLAILHNLTL
jgi:hypothetical protein